MKDLNDAKNKRRNSDARKVTIMSDIKIDKLMDLGADKDDQRFFKMN